MLDVRCSPLPDIPRMVSTLQGVPFSSSSSILPPLHSSQPTTASKPAHIHHHLEHQPRSSSPRGEDRGEGEPLPDIPRYGVHPSGCSVFVFVSPTSIRANLPRPSDVGGPALSAVKKSCFSVPVPICANPCESVAKEIPPSAITAFAEKSVFKRKTSNSASSAARLWPSAPGLCPSPSRPAPSAAARRTPRHHWRFLTSHPNTPILHTHSDLLFLFIIPPLNHTQPAKL